MATLWLPLQCSNASGPVHSCPLKLRAPRGANRMGLAGISLLRALLRRWKPHE